MGKSKRTRGPDVGAFIEGTLKLLPNEEERACLVSGLNALIEHLTALKRAIEALPNADQKESALAAAATLTQFLESARANPVLARALGMANGPRRGESRDSIASVNVTARVKELESLSTADIQQRLLNETEWTTDALRALARHFNIRAGRSTGRMDLVDQIVKLGFANRRGYDVLRSHQK